MAGTVLNLDIDSGTDYYLDTFYVDYTTNLPKDTTGCSVLVQVRSAWNDPYPYLTLSSNNGRILLGGTDGTILVRFTPEDTTPSYQNIKWSRGVYDLVITDPNGYRTKLLKGFINIIGTCSVDYAPKPPIIIWEFMTPGVVNTSVGNLVGSVI